MGRCRDVARRARPACWMCARMGSSPAIDHGVDGPTRSASAPTMRWRSGFHEHGIMLAHHRRHHRAVAAADHQPTARSTRFFQASARRPGCDPLREACGRPGGRWAAFGRRGQGRDLHPLGAVAAMLRPALGSSGCAFHGCRIFPRRHLGRRIGVGCAAIAILDEGRCRMSVGHRHLLRQGGEAAAIKSRASRIFCIRPSRLTVLQPNTGDGRSASGVSVVSGGWLLLLSPRQRARGPGSGKS